MCNNLTPGIFHEEAVHNIANDTLETLEVILLKTK
jgi:NADPH-dependent 7-cyano-7-deazaguanine reductase QueF